MSSVKQLAVWNSSSSAKFNPGAFLSVNLTACSTWSTASFCSPSNSRWGQTMATSCGSCMEPPSSPVKHGAILLAQLAGNHARRAETPLTRSTPLWRREWGRLVTTTFTGPLGARSRFTSALSVAAPISSERIGRNQYVAYRRHSVSGVAKDSARRVSEQMYCASFSASLSVKLRAACLNTSSTVSIASLNHNSAAIDMNRRANLSCMDVKDMVSLACSHREGRAPRLSGWKKMLAWDWELFIMVSSLSAAPAISISVGSSGASGIGGHQGSSGGRSASSASTSTSDSPSVVALSSSDEGSSTVSPAPSGPARGLARRCICKAGACSSSG